MNTTMLIIAMVAFVFAIPAPALADPRRRPLRN
jgi:hypothetical protein